MYYYEFIHINYMNFYLLRIMLADSGDIPADSLHSLPPLSLWKPGSFQQGHPLLRGNYQHLAG